MFSTLQPAEQRSSRKPHKLYDPLRSGASRMNGHTWVISYGDFSGAYGEVYVDRVTIEDLTVATRIRGRGHERVAHVRAGRLVDDLLGLGFTELGSITPNPQKTWFDNIRANPVGAAVLPGARRRRASAYELWVHRLGEVCWQHHLGKDCLTARRTSGNLACPASRSATRLVSKSQNSCRREPEHLAMVPAEAHRRRVLGASANREI